MNRCVTCGAEGALTEGETTQARTLDGCTYRVEGIPVERCTSCGETYMQGEALAHAELLIAFEAAQRGAARAEAFRFLRKSLALGGKPLGDLLGVSYATISRWENGYEVEHRAFALMGALVAEKLGIAAPVRALLEVLAHPPEPVSECTISFP